MHFMQKLITFFMAMIIGIPKEKKIGENRAAILPGGVKELTAAGATVLVEKGLAINIGYDDSEYFISGAEIVSGETIFSRSDMIVKVKEPLAEEIAAMKEGQVIFSFLHLAADPKQAEGLLKKKVTAIAFETITDNQGALPILTPMSQVAGRLAPQQGNHFLSKNYGGRGILLSGVPGTPRGKVTIIGAGVVGYNAAIIAIGLGAEVTLMDKSPKRLQYIDDILGNQVNTIIANYDSIATNVMESDLIIGAVLIPGSTAPKVVTKDLLKKMKPGSVIVDVSIDQGGCFETSRPTSHDNPTYEVNNIIHYCVTNMPGMVPRTSSSALENALLPYVLKFIHNHNPLQAMLDDQHLLNGLNLHAGNVTYQPVAKALGYEYVDPRILLSTRSNLSKYV